jgi:SAM-dependent methyltransferase
MVLELGCGDGRLLLPLAQAGAEVVGMDLHPGMLERCARRFADAGCSVELVCGDMSGFALPWRFDRIIIPYNSLYCLLTEGEQISCLHSAKEHLAPGGLILLDCYAADPVEEDPRPTEVMAHAVACFHDGERQIEVFERSVEDLLAQTIHATYDYHLQWDDGRKEQKTWTIPQRYIFPQQMLALLPRAGLALEALFGDFDEGAFTELSMQMIVVAKAAGFGESA